MVRRSYQVGYLFVRGKRRRMWVARWREDVIRSDGTMTRVNRSRVLGPVGTIRWREAQRILQRILHPLNQNRQQPQVAMTLKQFVQNHWEPRVLPTLKPGSAALYKAYLNRHLLPALGTVRLSDITRPMVQALLAEKRQQKYAGATLHCMRTALSRVLQEAVECCYLETNSARGIRVGERQPKRERLYLLPNQIQLLLGFLPEPCRTVVLVAVLTGLRIGELLALRWKYIDFLHGVIQVRETVYEGTFGTPKTRSSQRDVPMSKVLREALLAHRVQCVHCGPEDLVFASCKQTPINPKNLLNRVLRPACVELKLPPISWHSFRHTHATLLGEVGESLKTAQTLLGHSDLETTLNIYTHAIPESQRRAVEKVAGMLFPSCSQVGANSTPHQGRVN